MKAIGLLLLAFVGIDCAMANRRISYRERRQAFANCLEKSGAYCDYNCKSGYSQDPTSRCGAISGKVCCVPNVTPPPSLTTITPPLNQCGVGKYGTETGKIKSQSTLNRIVGGEEAYANEFPWIVSFQLDNEHMCGGSIIAKQWILTAAHCVDDLSTTSSTTLSRLRVVAGEHRLLNSDLSEVYAKVSKVVKHGSYNPDTMSNDIALLKLSAPLTFNSNIREICLPNATAGNFDKQIVVASGWGVVREGGFNSPNALQKVQLVTIPKDTCQSQLQSYDASTIIDSTMICASGNAKDTCQGDSGGPLIMRQADGQSFVQIGVVSWGYGCAQNLPGVYTRLTQFASWIANQMATN